MKRVTAFVFLSFTILFSFLPMGFSEPHPFTMEASFIEKQGAPGSVVHLSLKYLLPKGAKLYENPVINGLEPLTVLSIEHEPGMFTISLLVDSLDRFEAPVLTLDFLDKDNSAQQFKSNLTTLEVTPSIDNKDNTNELRPIKGIIEYNGLWKKIVFFILPLIAVIAGLVAWYRFKMKRDIKDNILYKDPPDIAAIKALEALNRSGLFEKGDVKTFYFSLSEIIRKYMERLRSFPAAELTTDEISSHIMHNEDREILYLLKTSDLIKFADERPTQSQKTEHCSMARAYIENTRAKDMAADTLNTKGGR